MGRPKQWDARILLTLTSEMLDRITAVAPDEDRLAFIRDAIERELRRRERETKLKPRLDK
jgi:hypothetical protein